MEKYNLTLTESLVFSSLISAVDPVAVLGKKYFKSFMKIFNSILAAIFEDIRVNSGWFEDLLVTLAKEINFKLL